MVQLDAHKIICSKECDRQRKDREDDSENMALQLDKLIRETRERNETILKIEEVHEERIAELYDEIKNLTKENKDKDVYIQRLERKSNDFVDEVYNTEQCYVSKIGEQEGKIGSLRKEILGLVQKNSDLREECDRLGAELERIKGEIRECNELRESMLISIETLTEENYAYIGELKQLKCENISLRDRVLAAEMQVEQVEEDHLTPGQRLPGRVDDMDRVGQCAGSGRSGGGSVVSVGGDVLGVGVGGAPGDGVESGGKHFSRVLVLCDEYGRGLDTFLRKHLMSRGVRYGVEMVIKPGASFAGVVEDIDCLTRHYTSKDYVVVVAGSNDFHRGKYPRFRLMIDKVRKCNHTNVVFLSVPYVLARANTRVYKYNVKLSEIVYRLNKCSEGFIGYIDFNLSGSAQSNKKLAAERLARLIGSNHTLGKNLIFIRSQDGVINPVNRSNVAGSQTLEAAELQPAVPSPIKEPENVSNFRSVAILLKNP